METRPSFKRAAATDFVMDFFLLEKNLLSFQRAKEHSRLSQKNPFLPSYTGAPQQGQTPTTSCAFPFASGNREAKRSSGAVCSFTGARLISAIPSMNDSAESSPRSTCFDLDSHSAVRIGDLMLSGSTSNQVCAFLRGDKSLFLPSHKSGGDQLFQAWPHGWPGCLNLFARHLPAYLPHRSPPLPPEGNLRYSVSAGKSCPPGRRQRPFQKSVLPAA